LSEGVRKSQVSENDSSTSANPEQPAAGSRSAYERLQAAELAAHGRVIQLQDGDPVKLKAAVQNWLMINKERRQTEFHLTADERKANVMVNWLEVEQDLEVLGTAMHFAALEAMDTVAVHLAGETDIPRCRILIRKCIPSVAVLSYSALVGMGVSPRMVAALARKFFGCHRYSMEDVERMGKILSEQMEQIAKDVITSMREGT
jgi:hypothetical protein